MPAAYADQMSKIVFFGDSLTDNGNLYSYLLHVVPKSPPYFEGRFSNGPTWAERVAFYFYQNGYVASSNYAVGGATAIFHLPTPKFIAPTFLEIEIDKYLLDTIFRDRAHTLFMIWIGGNDYLFDDEQDPHVITQKVVDKITWAINKLYDHGGRNFFVIGLPDLALLPKASQNGNTSKLHTLTVLHNDKLAAAMEKLRQKYSAIKIGEFDIYHFYELALSDLDGFNKAYNTHITNLKDTCWSGSILMSKSLSTASTMVLKNELTRALAETKRSDVADFDVDEMVESIVNNPALSETYQLGLSYLRGNHPCANPDDYLFWDHIHPTAVVHQVIADVVINKLKSSM
jgi:phospholipase/lecithinase/hemolysin